MRATTAAPASASLTAAAPRNMLSRTPLADTGFDELHVDRDERLVHVRRGDGHLYTYSGAHGIAPAQVWLAAPPAHFAAAGGSSGRPS